MTSLTIQNKFLTVQNISSSYVVPFKARFYLVVNVDGHLLKALEEIVGIKPSDYVRKIFVFYGDLCLFVSQYSKL